MKKQHFKPEFELIMQNQANAKFFVASGDFTNQPASTTPTPDPKAASQYEAGTPFGM